MKSMKKLRTILTLLALLLAVLCTAAAQNAKQPQLVRDMAGLLTADQAAELNTQANSFQSQYGVALNVLTIDDGGIGDRTIREYAKDLYREYAMGYGPEQNGALFMVDMSSRQYVTVTYGATAIAAFTDYAIDTLEAEIKPSLSNGDYYAAFSTFIATGGSYLQQAASGTPFDDSTYHADYDYMAEENTGFDIAYVFIGLIVGLVVAGITVLILRGMMKTAKIQREATAYVPQNGFVVTGGEDQFLYSHVTRTERPRDDDSGGGSSVDSDGFGGSDGGSF